MKPNVVLLILTTCCLRLQIRGTAGSASRFSFTAEQITELTAVEAVELLCTRSITAVQYATALLDRADEIYCLNTYATLHRVRVLEEAAAVDARAAAGEDVRPLCGLAFAVKDNIDVAGYPTEAGTPALQGLVQEKSSQLVTDLEAAHGVVLGKTRMHELAEGYTSISAFYGPVLNPYRVDAHVGGSSGGTAALVAARGAAAGFCSDTGGSCRVPAALTGVVGYRPTSSGIERQACYRAGSGMVPMTTSRDTPGLMARSVADIQFLDTIFNRCPRKDTEIDLRGYKIGYPREWWHDIGDETKPAFKAALGALKKAGVELVEFDVGLMLAEQQKNAPDCFPYVYEMPRELARYLYQHRYNFTLLDLIDMIDSPLVKESLEAWTFGDLSHWPTPQEYLHMIGTVTPKITQLWVDYFDNLGFDIILAPTTAITARPIDAAEPYSEINGRLEDTLLLYARTAEIDCPSAVPGLSIPIGLAADQLPIGLQLHSRPGDDGTLLSVGYAIEKVVAATPAPPRTPACCGCEAKVKPKTSKKKLVDLAPNLDGQAAAHLAAQELSIYSLSFEGGCEFLGSGSHERTEL